MAVSLPPLPPNLPTVPAALPPPPNARPSSVPLIVARQNQLCWWFLLLILPVSIASSFAGSFAPAINLAAVAITMVLVYRLGRVLSVKHLWLWVIGCCVPFAGWIVLYSMNSKRLFQKYLRKTYEQQSSHLQVMESAMHGCEAIITEFQMAGLTDQCEQSLDGPTDFSQATAMGHARRCEKVPDSPLTQLPAVGGRAISPVAISGVRLVPGMSWTTSGQGRNLVQQPGKFLGVMPLSTVMRRARGVPRPSERRCLLVPFLARSVGFLPVSAPKKRPDALAVDQHFRPIDLALSGEFAKGQMEQFLPHAMPLPLAHSPPAGNPRSAIHFLGKHLPGNSAAQTKIMPARQARSSTGGRPRVPFFALCLGRSGSMSSHSSSDTSGRSMTFTPGPHRRDHD